MSQLIWPAPPLNYPRRGRWIFNWWSNFCPRLPISVLGHRFATVEGAYVAAKSSDPRFHAQIARMDDPRSRTWASPGAIKRIGGTVPLRPDWETLKVPVMEQLLRRAWLCSPDQSALHSERARTGGHLVEWNNWNDRFWGAVQTESGWQGANVLGRLLCVVLDDPDPERLIPFDQFPTNDLLDRSGVLPVLLGGYRP